MGIEDLLFHRLKRDREWHVRNDLSSLLEQLQLAELLGSHISSSGISSCILKLTFSPIATGPAVGIRLMSNIRRDMNISVWRGDPGAQDHRRVLQVVTQLETAYFAAKNNNFWDFVSALTLSIINNWI